ncbi:MAG: AEC family transporter [Verrucomicrobiota bacterium]
MDVVALYGNLLGLIVAPVGVGVVMGLAGVKRTFASVLFAYAFYLFQTVVVIMAVWEANLFNNSWILPFIVLVGWIMSAGVALGFGRRFGYTDKEKGSFLFCICISNHGYTLLGIVAFVVFGAQGLAQATYAQFFIIPFLVIFCFPAARYFSEQTEAETTKTSIRRHVFDRRNLPLVAMLIGLGLNLGGMPRPVLCDPILKYAVYAGTLVSGVAIGLLVDLRKVFSFVRENVFSFVYRSSVYPLFFLGCAWILGLNPLDTSILVLFGIVPSAVFSNMIADMFDLDRDLTSSVYLVSTALFIVISLPVYLFLVECLTDLV